MMGYTMITNEEYKELLFAQEDAKTYKKCYKDAELRLKVLTEEFNELLLLLIKGQKKVEWADKKFYAFDLACADVVAEYINEKHLEDGMLILKENDK